MDIQKIITDSLVNGLSNKFDELIIDGLKLKGFEFKDIYDAESFVKNNCKCIDYKENEYRVFFVNDIPFMMHSYKIELPEIDFKSDELKINASYGSYAYL